MFKGITLYGAGIFSVVVVFSAVSVYVLDEFDPNLGRGISFQILCLIAAVLATVGALGFAGGVKILRAVVKPRLAAAFGAAAGIATLTAMMLGARAVSTTSGRQIVALLAVFGISLVSAVLLRSKRRAVSG